MDSKKKWLMLLLMTSVVALVVLLVVVINDTSIITDMMQKPQETVAATPNIEADGKVEGADLSAFMNDTSFFDETSLQNATSLENNGKEMNVAEEMTQEVGDGKTVSLLVTSVEKDLRIKIVDHAGNAVEGYPFVVIMDDTKKYEDTDQDGVLYIEGLKPGRYQLRLQEIAGFHVPKDSLEARVKAIVSYTVIDDISYLVHAESEVDVSVEDTAHEAIDAVDTDDTQHTSLLDTSSMENAVALGIDVSKWNGEIDWELVKAEGVDFAIIRCGYRGSSSGWLIEDPYFYKNLVGAKKAGVKVGVYFFTQATNTVEAVEEASMVISLLGEEKIDYPVFIDTEGAGGNGRADSLDTITRTAVCDAFCRTIENAGLKAGVYASRNWYGVNLNVDELEKYNIWLAEYRHTPLYTQRYDMWQYTSSGTVAGIDGRVDLNVSYLGY